MHARDNLQFKRGGLIRGNRVASGESMIGYLLAMDLGDAKKKIQCILGGTSVFNLPAVWVHTSRNEEAQFAGNSGASKVLKELTARCP